MIFIFLFYFSINVLTLKYSSSHLFLYTIGIDEIFSHTKKKAFPPRFIFIFDL